MTKNERLKNARIKSGLSQEELALQLGVNQAYVANLEKDKGFSLKKDKEISYILDVDPEVLYFGENTESSYKKEIKANPSITEKGEGVPYYDIDFQAGFDLVYNSDQVNPTFYIDFLPFNDADCWINVTGKSMGPLIAHGDIVALKEVKDWRSFLLEGEIYAIVTNNGFRTIKMLGQGKDEDHYSLIPYNKSEDYKPQPIPRKVITHVFRVKGAIKKFF